MAPTEKKKNNPVTRLTLGELDTISRKIGEDVMTAISEGTSARWVALAHVAWLHARREDPDAKLQTYLDMTSEDVGELLYPDAPDDEGDLTDEQEVERHPTAPAPEHS